MANTNKNMMSVIATVTDLEKVIGGCLYGVDRDAKVHLMSTRTFEGMRGRKTEYVFTIEGSENRIKVDRKENSDDMAVQVISPKEQKKMRNAYAKLCGEVSEKTSIPFEVVMAIGPDYAVEFVRKVQNKMPVEELYYGEMSRSDLCFTLELDGILETRIFEMGKLNYKRICNFLTKDRIYSELRKILVGADIDTALRAKKVAEDMAYEKEHRGMPFFCRSDFMVRIVSKEQVKMEQDPEKADEIWMNSNSASEFLMEIPKAVIKDPHIMAFIDHCVYVTDRYYYLPLRDAEKLQSMLLVQNTFVRK